MLNTTCVVIIFLSKQRCLHHKHNITIKSIFMLPLRNFTTFYINLHNISRYIVLLCVIDTYKIITTMTK